MEAPARAFSPRTFREAYHHFLDSQEQRRHSPATLAFYHYTAGAFTAWAEARILADPTLSAHRVVSAYVEAYLAEVCRRGVSDATLHAHARGVRALLVFAHEEGYLPDPVKVRMPKVAEKRPPVLSADELRHLIDACQTARDRALVMLLADSGLRRAEACALAWGDVDLETGRIRVRSGKGKKDRVSFVGLATREALRALAKTKPASPSAPVIGLKAAGLRMALRRLGDRAGLKVTAHMLRRAFAVQCVRAGMSVFHLQRLMGHASLEVTRRYVVLADDDLAEAHQEAGPIDALMPRSPS